MTDLGIGEPEPETDEDRKKIKEKHLKRIKRISKDLQVKESDFEITEEQKREIKRQEAKEGKVVVLHYDKVISVLEAKRKHQSPSPWQYWHRFPLIVRPI